MQSRLEYAPSRLAPGSASAAMVGDADTISAAPLEHTGIALQPPLAKRTLPAAGLETFEVAPSAVISLTSLSVRTRLFTTRVHQALDRSFSRRAEWLCTPHRQHESTQQRDNEGRGTHACVPCYVRLKSSLESSSR